MMLSDEVKAIEHEAADLSVISPALLARALDVARRGAAREQYLTAVVRRVVAGEPRAPGTPLAAVLAGTLDGTEPEETTEEALRRISVELANVVAKVAAGRPV
jgi:hypothetical protein